MRVSQIHCVVSPGDAITNQMLEIDARLRGWGLEAQMFAHHIAPELANRVRPDREYLPRLYDPAEALIYHYGLYDPNVRYYQAARGRRILIYHNITPARHYHGWGRLQELQCEVGRRTLPSLVGCDLALGDSDFNRRELVDNGFPDEKTGVLPIFLPWSEFETLPADDRLVERLRHAGEANFLTVGRVVPSKCIEDVIRIFYVYHCTIDARSRLFVVGPHHLPEYVEALKSLAAGLNLGDSIQFTGLVSAAELKSYYQAADLYLTASHHEGFCVPLAESMYYGVPILARKAGAIPETLGDSGVLLNRLGYAEAAEMAHLLVSDQALRARVIARQRERLQDLHPERVEAQLRAALVRLGILPAAG